MVKTRLKAEEFFALPLERGELVDGEVHEERPPKPEHGRIAGEVFSAFAFGWKKQGSA
jgi:Uma2 family endonuclease